MAGDEQAWWFAGEDLVRRDGDRHRITDATGREVWIDGATAWPIVDDPLVLDAGTEPIGIDLVRFVRERDP